MPAPRHSESPPSAVASTDWPAEAAKYAKGLDPVRLSKLAEQLRVPLETLNSIPLIGFSGVDSKGPCFTFPEVDAGGVVIGINRRYRDGNKRMMRGGRRGLTLLTGWADRPGAVFVVEGPTDAVAMSAAGLAGIGRPSNTGGVELLTDVLGAIVHNRPIIIVGENDRKPNGLWPGCDGAESVARRLAESLGRPVSWSLPPPPSKDVRDWLTDSDRGEHAWEDRGKALSDYLNANAVRIDPPNDPPAGASPTSGPNDSPDNPHRLAAGFLASLSDPSVGRVVRSWRGDFVEWRSGCYYQGRY